MTSKCGGDVYWAEDDVIELLAQLDVIVYWPKQCFSCHTEDQRNEEYEKILSQLSDKMERKYSPCQVREKLFSLYREGDATQYPESNFTVVFSVGSYEMRALNDSMRKRVKERFDHLRIWLPKTKRSASKRQTPSNRVASPTPTKQRVRKRGKEDSRAPRYHTKSRTSTPCNITPVRVHSRKKISRMSPSVVIARVKREASTIARSHVHSHLERTEIRDSIEKDSHLSFSADPSASAVLTPRTPQPSHPHKTTPEVPKSPQTENKVLLDIQEHEDLIHEGSYFRQKWEQAEAEIKQLKRERREKDALAAKIDSASFSFEAEIQRKNTMIADLRSQVSKQALLRPYFDRESRELDTDILRDIQSSARELSRQIAAIDQIWGLDYPNDEEENSAWCPGLVELVTLALGRNASSPVYRVDDIMDSGIPPQQFVQALIGTAVCEQVFRPKFKSAEMMSTSLLDRYRDHIATAYDGEILSSLDFASHRSVIKSDLFQKMVIPRKAKLLAGRHLEILASFIAVNEKVQCEAALMWRLVGIFKTALNLKVLVMTSKNTFEFIWPAGGSEFDVDTMETMLTRQEADQFHLIGKPQVVLPITPGFRVYSQDRQMVDYNGFVQMGDQVSGQQTVLVKSTVYTN